MSSAKDRVTPINLKGPELGIDFIYCQKKFDPTISFSKNSLFIISFHLKFRISQLFLSHAQIERKKLIWDKWIELHGYELDSIYDVADTNIGRIGLIFCQEGDYPEPARGLAMNGAEIIYRASAPEPAVSRGWWEIQNRARALDNTCYMVAPNVASYLVHPEGTGPVDNFGGQSMIVYYDGRFYRLLLVVPAFMQEAIIGIESLREYRENQQTCYSRYPPKEASGISVPRAI